MMTKRASLGVWFSLALIAVAAGAALTSWNLLRVMSGFRNAEAAGFLAVGRGVAEANQLMIGALYFATACGVVAVVAYVRAPDYSPPAWLVVSASALALVPLAVVWAAESLMLNVVWRDGVISNGTLIQRLLFVALGGGGVLSVLFFFAWVLRVSPAVAPKRTVVAVSLLIGCFILALVGFHLRNAWINGLYAHL